MNVDRKEAKELIDGYFETYPGVKAYMDKSIQVAQEKGYPHVKYKFYKGSSKARGSGIGLAVCEEIVSRHNGELIISNAEDEAGGCVVEVRLPTGT